MNVEHTARTSAELEDWQAVMAEVEIAAFVDLLPPLPREILLREEVDVEVEDYVLTALGYTVMFSQGQAKTSQLVGAGDWKFGGSTLSSSSASWLWF